jgi:3-oxoacyl-[acyl-carrier-protein] synthase-3
MPIWGPGNIIVIFSTCQTSLFYMMRSVITGTGSYIPPEIIKNAAFKDHVFYTNESRPLQVPIQDIISKFKTITGIEERRYAPPEITASDMAVEAARAAIADSGVDPETLDQIIVAHNYGNVVPVSHQSDCVPSLASRVKFSLGIRNPSCIAFDLLFGCPGWLQGLIQADINCRAGVASKCLVIGTETLSKVIDPADRDSMLFADGAGACIIEYKDTHEQDTGILGSCTQSDCGEEAFYIYFGKTYAPACDNYTHYIKMKGRKVYEYAVSQAPRAMKACLDKSGIAIHDLKKIIIHQANEKMDAAIVQELYKLYNAQPPVGIMPMSIRYLGNSSVATIPTLYHLVKKGLLPDHNIGSGDVVLFASVGAGMNINAVCYREQ